MDFILLLAGITFIVVGARRKDENGSRTGAGIAMLTIGIVMTIFGTIWFGTGFVIAFLRSFAQSSG